MNDLIKEIGDTTIYEIIAKNRPVIRITAAELHNIKPDLIKIFNLNYMRKAKIDAGFAIDGTILRGNLRAGNKSESNYKELEASILNEKAH